MIRERVPTKHTRITGFGALFVVCIVVFGLQAVTAGGAAPSLPPAQPESNASVLAANNTLVTVQSFGWFDDMNGSARIVTPAGKTVWEYDPPNSSVFDAELTDEGTILVAQATETPATRCPSKYRAYDSCVHNRVVEVAPATKRIVWQYGWYDAFVPHHEVHDADRLASGETAIVDMGNDRAFTVANNGTITWEWNATEHLGPGSPFRKRYGGPEKGPPESDWTHINDIDRLDNGDFQLSIRNFDTVLEVDPDTNRIVSTVGEPGNHTVLNHQHDPQRLEPNGTLLVADSENNRVIAIDPRTQKIVWEYTGDGAAKPFAWLHGDERFGRPLQWPRDADRLPNGNTLIADSRNFRVLEVNATGSVVWRYSLRHRHGIVYDADRLGVPEDPTLTTNATPRNATPRNATPRNATPRNATPRNATPRNATPRNATPRNTTAGEFTGGRLHDGPIRDSLYRAESWAGFVFPWWVRWPELITLGIATTALFALALEGVGSAITRLQRGYQRR